MDRIGQEDIVTDWLALVCLGTNYKEESREKSKITSHNCHKLDIFHLCLLLKGEFLTALSNKYTGG